MRHLPTRLMGNHAPPRVVMTIMGHSDLKTTMEIYSHVSSEMLIEASDAMQRILVGGNFSS
jgi:integrase